MPQEWIAKYQLSQHLLQQGAKDIWNCIVRWLSPFTLASISSLEWNHDIVLWGRLSTLKNVTLCADGVDAYLRPLNEDTIPTIGKKIGVGSPGTLWPGCLRYMPSTGLISFDGLAVCLDLSGFSEWRSTSSPTNQSASRTACISPWVTRKAKLKNRFYEVLDRTQRRFTLSIKARALTRRSSWIQAITITRL